MFALSNAALFLSEKMLHVKSVYQQALRRKNTFPFSSFGLSRVYSLPRVVRILAQRNEGLIRVLRDKVRPTLQYKYSDQEYDSLPL